MFDGPPGPCGVLLIAALALCTAGCTCERPRTAIPTYRATERTIDRIDGRLDDWEGIARTERFVSTLTGDPEAPEAYARIAWDADNFYAAFEVTDTFLKQDQAGDDPHLWEQDTVEIMLDPDGDGANYFELQLAPNDQTFDTRYDARRVPQPFGHVDWDSGIRGKCTLRGTLNDDGADEGYVAELAIPWSAFAAGSPPASAPRAGDEWRVALYVLDARREGQGGVGWSPPLVGDFHVPERFGRVEFGAR